MKSIKPLVFKLSSLVFLSLMLAFPSVASAAPGAVSTWTTNGTSIPTARSYAVTVTYNGFVYVVGGWNGSAGSTTTYYAPINANGSVGTWVTSGTSLPVALRVSFGLAHNGFMYVMGGLDNSDNRQSAVYYAQINPDGSLGSWATNANALPQTLQESMTIVRDGYIYVYGGYNVSTQSSVYYAPVNVNGSIGTWVTDTSLPGAKSDTSAVLQNDRVYLVGGLDSGVSSTDTVYYAGFDSDHSMGTWASTTSLPAGRSYPGVAANDGYIYVTGGENTGPQQSTVFSAKVKSDGTLATWATSANSLPSTLSTHGSVIYNNFLYAIGGRNSINVTQSTVYYASVTPPVATATATNPVTLKPIAISTGWGTDITCSSATQESSLAVADANYSYPVGLVSFCYDTDAGASNQVTVTFVTDLTPSQVTARHFNSTTGTYTTIPGAVITATTYASQPALQVVYTIADNGSLDTNATTGSVTDPVGLALAITAPNTGLQRQSSAPIITIMIVGALLVTAGFLSSKKGEL